MTSGYKGVASLVALALAMLLSSLGVSIANVALPTLTQAFGASFQAVQWVVVAYLLAITVTIVSVGRLGDVMGHRRVLLAGIGLFTLASILCGLAPSLWLLVAARALQGMGAAILMALTVALVRETVPKDRTGAAMGMLGTMSAIGTALGPSLGGLLIAGSGWRAIFLVMVPLGIASFLLACRYLSCDAGREPGARKRFDSMGTVLLGLTLAAYALSVTIGDGQFGRVNLVLLVMALLCAGLFILVEKRMTAPLLNLSLFRNTLLSASLIMNALVAAVMMTTLVVGPFFLSQALGLNEALVGLVLSIGPLLSALSGIPAGRLVDRFGASTAIIFGLFQMVVATFALVLLPDLFGLVGFIMAIALLTPAYQLFQAANNTAVMMDVHADQRGVISGMLSLARNIGFITGASVMGAVFAFASGMQDMATTSPEVVAFGMQVTFAVATGLIVFALTIAVVVYRMAPARSVQ